MTKLTTHILAETTNLKETIESLHPLNCDIIIGVTNSENYKICKEMHDNVVMVKGNRSEIKNKLVEMSKTEWQFYLEPGETLSSGYEYMMDLSGSMKRIYVIQDDIISKEVRLWKKGDAIFHNPVFENLQPETNNEDINVFISGSQSTDRLNELLEWKKQNPTDRDVEYYLACQYLTRKEYDNFLKHAECFLFRESELTYSVIMTRYYLGLVKLHIYKNSHEAIQNLIMCVAEKPLMAEFWCAIGDCYYRAGVPEKAIEFFKNAIQLGKERLTNDPYPIELSKYGEYPIKMIELCGEIKKVRKDR